MSSDDFARVLAEAGEPPAAKLPDGWEKLARMREDLAAHRARAAARWAANAEQRRAALELYQRTSEAAGAAPGRIPPWLGEAGPSLEIFGAWPMTGPPRAG